MAKWADNSGTLADSALTEVGGNLGIGTQSPNPNGVLHVNKSQNTGTALFVTNNNTGGGALSSVRAGLNPADYAVDYTTLTILGANWPAGAGGASGTAVVSAINDPATSGVISEARLSPNVAKLNTQNAWTGQNTFVNGLSVNGTQVVNVGNPVSATDATNKAYVDSGFVKFVPGAEQLSVGDANGTAAMINLRGGSTCCSGPGGHTPA